MDNTSLYLDFMNTDNYWSLARETQNNRYNLKTIPLVEDFYSTVQIIRHKSIQRLLYHTNANQKVVRALAAIRMNCEVCTYQWLSILHVLNK